MAKILHIFRAPKMEELEEVRVIIDVGLEGCAHGRPGSGRQVLLVDRETLEAMELQPGIVRENITTDGIDVNSLAQNQLLRIGEVRLEVSEICHRAISWEKYGRGCGARCAGDEGCCAGYWKAE